MNPDSSFFETFKTNDIEHFFESELSVREITGFPPFCKLGTVFFTARDRNRVADVALKAKKYLETLGQKNGFDLEILALPLWESRRGRINLRGILSSGHRIIKQYICL